MAKKKTGAFSAELLDELLNGQDPATVLQSDGLHHPSNFVRLWPQDETNGMDSFSLVTGDLNSSLAP